MKFYKGRIPACGVFCGGCPMYMREERPCQGADLNRSRCEKCKTFHLCCLEKGITHCFQCTDFPCAKFKGFAKRWLKYGQNFVENQELLKGMGEVGFLKYYNGKVIDYVLLFSQQEDYLAEETLKKQFFAEKQKGCP